MNAGITPRQMTELALIGCCMEQPLLAADLQSTWFDDLRLGDLLERIKRLARGVKSIDWGLLWQDRPDDEHMQLLQSAIHQCYSPANFPEWREQLLEQMQKAQTTHAILQISAAHKEPEFSVQSAIKTLESAIIRDDKNKKSSQLPHQIAANLVNHLEEKFNLNGKRSGLETGFYDLDRMTDGLQFGEFSVLAARPSKGKTSLACNLVDFICLKNKIPTLFITLEMSGTALSRRMLSASKQVAMNNLKSGQLSETDFAKCATFNQLLKNSPLYFEEGLGGLRASAAAAMIRHYADTKGVRFVVIDYLQKIRSDTKNEKRTYEVAETSGILTGATKETGVATLCLAQLNREGEKNKGKDDSARRPKISDLSDSGQIERDADNVFLLHPCQNYTEIVVGKQRDGETGIIRLTFDGRHCHFRNMELGSTNPHFNDP
jgi:replicative DNA helicase